MEQDASDEVLASEAPNESRDQRQGNHRGPQRTSADLAESAKIEGFTEDETTEDPGESVQLGREQSWMRPKSKTNFGFEIGKNEKRILSSKPKRAKDED
ncbi:hypothetical protein Nepgr_027225 [Nepenthes gracilis]|uniref:Uncharacterized protein n=1 Tax=Nepenthes gracilis TaxID=150966 RepID=A0AAD3TBD4_NEPGR|nr:hypothetical protein Nepgr_027225 [Nepenthes gracilis]